MAESQYQITHESNIDKPGWTGEKTAWWVVFGVLVLSILMMLGAWD